MDTSKFESLGDNCELGTIKRRMNDEGGGLLRWATSPPDVLIPALQARFAGLYEYDDIVPAWDDIVQDTKFGFTFHSRMKSKIVGGQREWVETDESRRKIYEDEKNKIDYLVDKLIKRIKNPDVICVYKTNDNASDAISTSLSDALSSIGPAKLLVVRKSNDKSRWGTVEDFGKFQVGYIDTFAPYDDAWSTSKVWLDLLANFAEGEPPPPEKIGLGGRVRSMLAKVFLR